MKRVKPVKTHWLKWAGRKPENRYSWSIPGYWFRCGARVVVKLFKMRGAELPNAEDIIHEEWVSHMRKCEPSLVKEWEK